MIALHDPLLTILGMVVITVLLCVGIIPGSSERVYRFMCLLAAASLIVLVVENT